jgi:hypothetical protein
MPHHLVYDGDLLYSRSLVTLEKPQGLTLESQRVLTDKSFEGICGLSSLRSEFRLGDQHVVHTNVVTEWSSPEFLS